MSDESDLPAPREPETIEPDWHPTPEQQARMNAFVAKYFETHRVIGIFCRALPPDPDRPDQIRLEIQREIRQEQAGEPGDPP